MNSNHSRSTWAIFIVMLLFSCATKNKDHYKIEAGRAEFLHRTMKAITDRMVHDIFSPPVASRIYAYASVAAYEAIIQQDKNFVSLAGQVHGLDSVPAPDPKLEYCFPLSSTHAMLIVGRNLIFSESEFEGFMDSIHTEFKNTGMPSDVYERSISYGDVVAKHIMAWASMDNYKQSRSFPKYSVLKDPGTWKPTPPAYMDAIEPSWNKIRPFAIDSAAQFRPPVPTTFSIEKESQFYKEAIEVYDVGRSQNDEEHRIAAFWDCNPFAVNVRGHLTFAIKKLSPGGHWISITREVCTKSKVDIVRTAEAYARVSISLADGFISCWDEKYRSSLIRPETYIHQYIDKDWLPLLQTPPFPEYTSGHSVISGAASVALTELFGDSYAFTDSTEVEFGLAARSFKSFRQASEEAGISRMYGGIHYRPAVENGLRQGKLVGEWVAQKIVTRKNQSVN